MKSIPEGNYRMLAKTFYGLENLLADELTSLGAMRVEKQRRAVSFWGDKGFMYKANLNLRTALSILKPIKTDKVFNERQLYKVVGDIAWEDIFSENDSLLIDATVHSEIFTNSHYVELKCKDAIVDRLRDKSGKRPSIDKDNPGIKINVHIADTNLTISLDSSGASLHKRGYRLAANVAPINEVMAAAMVLFSGWKGGADFLDPMCGSGTILIEAAMIAANIPVNINRQGFAFQNWRDYDEDLFNRMKDISLVKIRDINCKIQGFDIFQPTVIKARENVKAAGLDEFIRIDRGDFFMGRKEEGDWLLMFNPPYGERMNGIETIGFYKKIGDTLKQNYDGASAWIITSSMEGLKSIGLRHSRSIPLMNSNLEARFVKYEMYGGTKKDKKGVLNE